MLFETKYEFVSLMINSVLDGPGAGWSEIAANLSPITQVYLSSS